jgi:hypothetical protein
MTENRRNTAVLMYIRVRDHEVNEIPCRGRRATADVVFNVLVLLRLGIQRL